MDLEKKRNKVRTSITVDPALLERVKKLSIEKNISVSSLIEKSLETFINSINSSQ